MTMAFTLDALQNQLRFCLRENAAIIYWSHAQSAFDYLLLSDRRSYRAEMRNLRTYHRDGRITHLCAGEPVDIDGTLFYPIEVTYRQDIQCGAYFLLRMRGEMNDLDKTPYFFVSESKRDEILEWLIKVEGTGTEMDESMNVKRCTTD